MITNDIYASIKESPLAYLHREEGMDTGFVHIPTQIYDTVIDLSTGDKTIIHDGQSNLIVIGFGLLVACVLKGGHQHSFPISYWAVGTGEGAFWDDLTPSQLHGRSRFDLTSLYNETFRVATTSVFLNSNDDPVPSGPADPPTNRLEIRAIFGPSVSGSLREFGIFGGNATATLGSGLMIDHKGHNTVTLNQLPGFQQAFTRALRLTL